jgi:hypothetical protein
MAKFRQRYPSQRPTWRITILSRDGQRLIFYTQCEDEKEIQALATEARHACLSSQILIRPPIGELYSWD